jgi:N-acetylmuramoyl-L-alanine amidase
VRRTAVVVLAIGLLWWAPGPAAQGTGPLVLVTPDGRRQVPTTIRGDQELIALGDVASLFQVAVGENPFVGGVTVTYRDRTIVLTPDQSMASVDGQIVALPSAPVRSGQQWLVPVEFLPRALGRIYDRPIELRRASRLLIVGDVRVPRVTARVDTSGATTRAIIEISPPAQVTAAGDTTRIDLRIESDALDLALPSTGGGLIQGFRPGDQPNTVSLMLGPGAGAARWAPSTTADMTRVTIEIDPAVGAPLAEAPPAAAPGEAPAAPAEESPDPFARRRAAIETIVIDPGHGGEDRGARGPGGVLEKDVTLAIARQLRTALETQLGVRVVLTRNDDRAVALDERAAVANNSKADLFLSLHANAALSTAVAGAEVIYVQLDREGEAAGREAAASAVALPVVGGGTRVIDVVRWDLAQARYVDSSAVLATLLEEELGRRITMGPRPLQRAPLRVLASANMPAALIELAYLSNPGQERLAMSADYQHQIAQAILAAVVRFRDHLEERRTE